MGDVESNFANLVFGPSSSITTSTPSSTVINASDSEILSLAHVSGSKYVKKDQSYEKLRTEATSMSLDERCQSAQSLLDTSDTSVTSVIPQITCR